jgi:hypothetical protein
MPAPCERCPAEIVDTKIYGVPTKGVRIFNDEVIADILNFPWICQRRMEKELDCKAAEALDKAL